LPRESLRNVHQLAIDAPFLYRNALNALIARPSVVGTSIVQAKAMVSLLHRKVWTANLKATARLPLVVPDRSQGVRQPWTFDMHDIAVRKYHHGFPACSQVLHVSGEMRVFCLGFHCDLLGQK
jgi:hypothetical protein